MGKQTLIHPVPLSVLRGALEFCGWKFKSLKQIAVFDDGRKVAYKITGLKPPSDAPRYDPLGAMLALQRCYNPPVLVDRVVMDTSPKIDAWIVVQDARAINEQEAWMEANAPHAG